MAGDSQGEETSGQAAAHAGPEQPGQTEAGAGKGANGPAAEKPQHFLHSHPNFLLLGTFLAAALPALFTFLNITYEVFPELKRQVVPAREIALTNLRVAERDRVGRDGIRGNAIYYDISAVGYQADKIDIAWLIFDPQTLQRTTDQPTFATTIDFNTQTDRIVGQLDVPEPADPVGCIVVRIFAVPVNGHGTDEEPKPDREWLLYDVADTAPFDPVDPLNPQCPAVPPAATPLAPGEPPVAS